MRRRRHREQPFGFDAFVDLVTNLVGIVLRLILVVMMGAHLHGLYKKSSVETDTPASIESAPTSPEESVLQGELADRQAEVAQLQARLLDTLKAMDVTGKDLHKLSQARTARSQQAEAASTGARSSEDRVVRESQATAKLRDDRRSLQERIAELEKAMADIEKQPPDKRLLQFHHPLSRPVSSGELIFELRNGRVSFIDLQAFLDEVKQNLSGKVEVLRKQWETTDLTAPVGAFQMRYTIVRERSGLERAAGNLGPTEERGFSCGLDTWEIIPLLAERGESLPEALADGSRFRQIVDTADADQVVLTFFVYADSFTVYRQLRDYLYDRSFMVAGRPLGLSRPIAGSRNGSASRGQ